jgi:hypothetical protein
MAGVDDAVRALSTGNSSSGQLYARTSTAVAAFETMG